MLLFIGIAFLLLGIYCYMSFWLMVYSPFALVLGIVLILFSSYNAITKSFCIIMPLIIFGVIFLRSLATPIKVIIPKGYVGTFRIIHGFPCGDDSVLEKGKLVLKVPPNGLVKTKENIRTGWTIRNEYYYINEQDNMIPLESIHPSERNNDEVSLYFGTSGSITRFKRNYKILEGTVFKSDLTGVTDKMLEELTEKEVKDCIQYSNN